MAANTAGILNYRASGVQNTCRIFSHHLSGVQNTCRIFSHHPSVVQNTCRIGSPHPSAVQNTGPSRPLRPLRSPKNGRDIQTPPPPPSPFRRYLVGRMQYAPTLTDKKIRTGGVGRNSIRPTNVFGRKRTQGPDDFPIHIDIGMWGPVGASPHPMTDEE